MIWFIILVETTIKTIWLFGVPCAQLVSGDRITPHLWTNRKVACKGSHKKPRSWGTKKRSPWLFSPLSYPPWKLTNVPWPWMFWKMIHFFFEIWMLPKIVVPPNHPFNRAGFSIINHPFWGTPIFGNTHMLRIFSVFFFHHVSESLGLGPILEVSSFYWSNSKFAGSNTSHVRHTRGGSWKKCAFLNLLKDIDFHQLPWNLFSWWICLSGFF